MNSELGQISQEVDTILSHLKEEQCHNLVPVQVNESTVSIQVKLFGKLATQQVERFFGQMAGWVSDKKRTIEDILIICTGGCIICASPAPIPPLICLTVLLIVIYLDRL